MSRRCLCVEIDRSGKAFILAVVETIFTAAGKITCHRYTRASAVVMILIGWSLSTTLMSWVGVRIYIYRYEKVLRRLNPIRGTQYQSPKNESNQSVPPKKYDKYETINT